MTTIRPFLATDSLRFNSVNLDPFTETFYSNYYASYLASWPELFYATITPSGEISGYMMGKVEGEGANWHGHVSAVTVSPRFRRLGIASILMAELESLSDQVHKAFFVDLYVRPSNFNAVQMYKRLGYVVYRRVLGYYSSSPGDPAEDAYDMRKSLSRDVTRKTMIPMKRPTKPTKADAS